MQEATRDPNGQLQRQLSRVYDTLNRLQTVADANAVPVADYSYDANGAIDTTTDALGRVHDQDLDALGRLVQSIANRSGTGSERAVTGYGYDTLDRLRTVIDPNGLTTTYGYDGFGNQTSLQSPDTGTTTYTYDSAGHRITQTDARGITLTYAYDAAGRITSITPPTEPAVTFTYDQADSLCTAGENHAAGRLTRMTDASGVSRYCYDRDGNIVRRQHALTDGPTLTVRASHSTAGRSGTLTYPSGATVRYVRNTQGQIIGVHAKPTANATEAVIADAISYLPFGPLSTLRYGNGRVLTKTNDRNYAIAQISDNAIPGFALDFTTDAAGNIVALSEQHGTATTALTIAYDDQNRLTALRNGADTMQAFDYDATGNRTSISDGSTMVPYGYANGSHRLASVGTSARSYDAAGNTTAITGTHSLSLSYDERGRLREVSEAGAVKIRYRYNGRGERIAKQHPTDASKNRWFIYADDGKLLGEYTGSGMRIAEYVWLDDTLIAVLSEHAGSGYQFVETDHLGTPRAVVHPSRNEIVWRWDLSTSAFGEQAANSDADADGVGYVFNLRYPGQYFDAESGLHYNYFRDYDPGTGRYVQSDPIGLRGGMNTYGYALQRPTGLTDFFGLDVWMCSRPMRGASIIPHDYICAPSPVPGEPPVCGGHGPTTAGDSLWGPGADSNEEFSSEQCELKESGNCEEKCVRWMIEQPRPLYSAVMPGVKNCWDWAEDSLASCKAMCAKDPKRFDFFSR